MKMFGRYLDINNLRSLEIFCNHLGGERGPNKKQSGQSALYHHLQPQALQCTHSSLFSIPKWTPEMFLFLGHCYGQWVSHQSHWFRCLTG